MVEIDPTRTRDRLEVIVGKREKEAAEAEKKLPIRPAPVWPEMNIGEKVRDKVTRMGGEIIGRTRKTTPV